MNSNKYRHVRRGQKLSIPANVYNTLIDSIKKQPLNFKVYRKLGTAATPTIQTAWAEIIVAPVFQNPYAAAGSGAFSGSGEYICRLLSSEYDEFVADKDPAYTLNAQVTDPFDNRVYTMTNSEGITYPALAPHENATDWEVSEEIKIEYALGSGATDATEILVDNVFPAFPVGAKVKITSRIFDDGITTRYYIDASMTNMGDEEDRGFAYVDGVFCPVFI